MASRKEPPNESAPRTEIEPVALPLHPTGEDALRSLIENPGLSESQMLMLLKRSDLPASLLEEIGRKRAWRESYPVRVALASHPHMPRPAAMKLLRDLHLMDLVRISTLPIAVAELRNLAEERILAQLPQLPLGQRLMLARRGSGRVAAGVLADGPPNVAKPALDNPLLTEAHLLKMLAQDAIAARSLAALAEHKRWSNLINIRVALVRHKDTPVDRVLAILPALPRKDIQDLLEFPRLPGSIREFLRQELIRRDKI